MKSEIEELRKNNSQLMLAVTKSKVAAMPANKQYVASQQGHKVHQVNCLFARNIAKRNRIVFNTKTKALNEGYKLCNCLAY